LLSNAKLIESGRPSLMSNSVLDHGYIDRYHVKSQRWITYTSRTSHLAFTDLNW